MASVQKRGKAWRVRWVDPSGVHRSRQFPRKIDADQWAVKVSHQILEGSYVTPTRMTVREWGEEWRKTKLHRPSTRVQVESHLRRHVYPAIGDLPVGKVRPSHIQAMVNGLSEKLAPATVETVYKHTASIFGTAVRDRLIVSSPCVDIDLPAVERGVVRLLTADEIWQVADDIDGAWRVAVVLGAAVGLRPGEALGLEVRHVDFLRHSISVEQQLWTPPRGQPELQPPKTAESRRVVPVPDFVTNEIAAHLAASGVRSGLITPPTRRWNYTQAWRKVAPDWATPHDLRHFYASLLISEGADVKVVQRRLGHKAATTTLDVYGHLWHDREDATRTAVGRVLAPQLPAPLKNRRSTTE